jgi:hypothetical protein
MTIRVVATLLLAVASTAAGQAQSFHDLLQRGIYAQDTAGDFGTAIRYYEQIVKNAPPSSDIRTQAARRLESARQQLQRAADVAPLAVYDGRTYRHKATGLTLDVPEGWRVNSTLHSSDNGEMVTFAVSNPRATVAVWMIPEKNTREEIEERLQRSPSVKMENRRSMFAGYHLREGSVQRLTIGGHDAIVAIGEYTETFQNGEFSPYAQRAMAELMTWVYTENTHTFFFAPVPLQELERLRPNFDALVYSAIIP